LFINLRLFSSYSIRRVVNPLDEDVVKNIIYLNVNYLKHFKTCTKTKQKLGNRHYYYENKSSGVYLNWLILCTQIKHKYLWDLGELFLLRCGFGRTNKNILRNVPCFQLISFIFASWGDIDVKTEKLYVEAYTSLSLFAAILLNLPHYQTHCYY